MPRKQKKRYNRPRKLYDITLIKEENGLIKKYGLKSRREVWRASFAVEKMRNIAKSLITASQEEQEKFISRQREKGFNVNSIADVLALSKEDYLKRRLQSVLVSKGLAKTHRQARQFITHKHAKIKNNSIDSPSHLTTLEEERELEIDLELPIKEVITEEDRQILNKINKE